ncbi:MAG: hypothetical protein AB1847_01225 [bacterium]
MDSPLIASETVNITAYRYPESMQTADILDWGFGLYRQAPGQIWPLVLLGSLPFVLTFLSFYYFFAVLKFSPLALTSRGPFQSISIWSFCLTVLFFWRTVLLGAQTVALDRIFTGRPAPVGTSLLEALKKGISLCAFAATWGSFFVLSAFLLFIPYLVLGGGFSPALSLVTLEGLPPLHALKAVRSRMPGFFRRCLGIHLIIFVLWGMIAANILIGLYFILSMLHSVFDVNISYWQNFFSFSNQTYLYLVLGVSFLLTEPLRAASGWLLYHDCKVRKEGYDLRQMADRLIKKRCDQ